MRDKAIIIVTHLGGGTISFQVPLVSEGSRPQITPRLADAALIQDNPGMAPFYLELLHIGGIFLGKNASFYIELLREGFLKNGVITLVGFIPGENEEKQPERILKTVIQFDGDIICQVNRELLKNQRVDHLITCFSVIQHQLLEEFQAVVGSIVIGSVVFLSSIASFFLLIYRLCF